MSPTKRQTLCAAWTAGVLAVAAAPDAGAFDLLTKGAPAAKGSCTPRTSSSRST